MGCGTLAALALTGAGAGLGVDASIGERNAMNNAVNQQLAAQQGFQKQATPVFQQSLGASTPQAMQGQQQAGQQQAAAATRNAALQPLASPSLPFSNPATNISYQGQQAKNAQQQGASAALRGYSNIGLQQALKDLSANSQLGLIGNQARSSASVFPYLLQGASQSRSGEASLGSLLGSLGTLTGLGSAAGLFGSAATPSSTIGWANALKTPIGGSVTPLSGYMGIPGELIPPGWM